MKKNWDISRKVIGLTGSIAAGKSEVAKNLAHRGAYIIEADEIGHKLLLPRSEVWSRILGTFGPQILKSSGAIDRNKLGKVVFADRKKLRKLNEIMHPMIKDMIEHMISKMRSRTIVINAALPQLFSGLVDLVIVVDASKAVRLARLLKKGVSKEQVLKMINSQMSKAAYLKLADIVITNNGTRQSLADKVKGLM